MSNGEERATTPPAAEQKEAKDKYPIGHVSGGFTVTARKDDLIVWRRVGTRKTTFIVDRFSDGKLSRVKLTNDEAEAYKTAGLEAPKQAQPAASGVK